MTRAMHGGMLNERNRWETGGRASQANSATALVDLPDKHRSQGNGQQYQARWISREQINRVRKAGGFGRAVLVDYRTGFVVVEPVGSNVGDGEVLSPEMADYELREAWCPTPRSKLIEARRLLGLDGSP